MGGFRASILPRVRLSEESFAARHRALRAVLWLQLPILAVVTALQDPAGSPGMAGMDHLHEATSIIYVMTAALVVCAVASTFVHGRRTGAVVVSVGLLLSAALLVSAGGGSTDLHFGFFLMIGLISLYQDWLPLALAVVLILLHHLLLGEIAPALLYSEPIASVEYVRFALVHGGFILGSCAIQIVYWRFAEHAEREKVLIRAEAAGVMQRSAERYEALVQDGSDVIAVVSREERITSVNAAAYQVMGYRSEEMINTNYRSLIQPEDMALLSAAFADGRAEHRTELRIRHADGSWHWHDMAVRDLRDNPAVAGWVLNHRDVTERRAFQDRLKHEAAHDLLTGLANRGEFLRALGQGLADAETESTGLAVLYLDLDGFKQVNDVYGHETGDALLVAVSAGLRRCVLGSDTVGRLGGDEFAVLLNKIEKVDDAATTADRILTELRRPVVLGAHTIVPGASIGISLATPGVPTDMLLHQADTAMYHAKRDPTAGWRVYVDGLHDPSVAAPALEDDLREALDSDRLHLQYQPVVDLLTGDLTGFEALIRWRHPVLGLLQPGDFIALAEQSELIDRLGAWVLTNACRQVLRWQRQLPTESRLGLSVNISAAHLIAPTSVDRLLAILHQTGFAPGDLTIEIAESAVIDADPLVEQLAELQGHGVRIALDDFGTGYSSLRYLTRLPVDALKIDTCFVAELDGTRLGSAVPESVIRLATILNLDTIAEGVETAAQAAELTLLGCRAAQGYLYAHPLDAEQVDALIESGGRPTFSATR